MIKNYIVLAVCVLFFSCKKEKQYPIQVLNISDAQNLVLFKNTTSLKSENISDEETALLYKLTIDGKFEEVTFVNSDGSVISNDVNSTEIAIKSIVELSSDFLLFDGRFISFDTQGNKKTYTTILVSKKDGSIYDFPEGYYIINGIVDYNSSGLNNNSTIYNVNCRNFYNSQNFAKDSLNRIYFAGMNGTTKALYRLDLNKLPQPTLTDITISGKDIVRFEVDGIGNLYWLDNDRNVKVLKNSGGIQNILKIHDFIGTWDMFWIGNDGYFNAFGKIFDNKANNFNLKDSIIGGEYIPMVSWAYFLIRNEDNVYFVNRYPEFTSGGYSFNETKKEWGPCIQPIRPTGVLQKNDTLYMYKSTELYRMSLKNNVSTKILSDEYEIYTLGFKSGNTLIFSGLRYSDNTKVIGEISESGTVKIIDQEINKEAISLIKIN